MQQIVGEESLEAVPKDGNCNPRGAGACLPPIDGGRKARRYVELETPPLESMCSTHRSDELMSQPPLTPAYFSAGLPQTCPTEDQLPQYLSKLLPGRYTLIVIAHHGLLSRRRFRRSPETAGMSWWVLTCYKRIDYIFILDFFADVSYVENCDRSSEKQVTH